MPLMQATSCMFCLRMSIESSRRVELASFLFVSVVYAEKGECSEIDKGNKSDSNAPLMSTIRRKRYSYGLAGT